ncbi:MAG: hypothetical protein MZU91_02915 [Desulfosudis oleivorans]|nr:hypothetical protein [Desulfosudis oleivorans]
MKGCTLCPRRCGIDRSEAERRLQGQGGDPGGGRGRPPREKSRPWSQGQDRVPSSSAAAPCACCYCQNNQISHLSEGRAMHPG